MSFVKALVSCTLLALQFGLQPLLSSNFIDKGVMKTSIVFSTELEKIIIAIFAIFGGPTAVRNKIYEGWSMSSSVNLAALPAVLYTVQNVLILNSQMYIDSMTFNLLNQTKTIWAAIWLYLILNQKQSYMQMVALLIILVAAVVLNTNFGTVGTDVSPPSQHYHIGVLCVLTASAISGLSTALTQRALVSGIPRETVFFSAELAIYSILVLLAKEVFYEKGVALTSFFSHWTWWTLLPVTANALGGIIIGFVTKYAGGVRKGFALIAGILVTAFAQWVVEGKPLRSQDWMALGLVCFAIFLHSKFPVAKGKVTSSSIKDDKLKKS